MEKIQWKNQTVNFVAIVVGVYLAFVVNKCQIDSDTEDMEKQYLSSIHADMLRDQAMIKNHLHGFDVLQKKTSLLIKYVNGQGGSKDSLDYYLSGIMTQTTFNSYNFAFQSLVASGHISDMVDFELVKELTELYNGKYADIKTLNQLGAKVFQDEVMPRVVYDGKISDKYLINDSYLKSQPFINLAMVCQNVMNQQVAAYKKAQTHLEAVLKSLETEIEEN